MSVIVIVQGNPSADGADAQAQYSPVARDTIARHGGEVVTRGACLGSLAGDRPPFKVGLLIRFPDEAKARAWYADPDYQKVLPLRAKAYSEIEITLYQEP